MSLPSIALLLLLFFGQPFTSFGNESPLVFEIQKQFVELNRVGPYFGFISSACSGPYEEIAKLLIGQKSLSGARVFLRLSVNGSPPGDGFSTARRKKELILIESIFQTPNYISARILLVKTMWPFDFRYAESIEVDGALSFLENTLKFNTALSNGEKKEIYRLLILANLKNNLPKSAHTWVSLYFKDFKEFTDECSALLLLTGISFFNFKEYFYAITCFDQIVKEFPRSADWGAAKFNLGVSQKKSKDIPAAIETFIEILPSNVNDKDPGSNLMELTQNFRTKACHEISLCYEEIGSISEALDYENKSLEFYPKGGCGNCFMSFYQALTKRIIALKEKLK